MASMGSAIECDSHSHRDQKLHHNTNCQRDPVARVGFFCNSHSDKELYHHRRSCTRPNVNCLETMGCPNEHQFDNRLSHHSSCFHIDSMETVGRTKHNDDAE